MFRARLERAWSHLERFVSSRAAAPVLVLAALGAYGITSLALPLSPGRDLARYLLVYVQLFDERVVYPNALVTRTPGTPLVVGGVLELGPLAAEVFAALLYALSILAWCWVARRFGPGPAIVTAVALLLYPGYVMLFHQLSSDAVFAAGFAGFAVFVVRALEHPSAGRAAALGAGVAGLVLIRPVSQVLLVLVLLPLFAGGDWRGRIRATAAFATAAIVPLVGLAIHNHVRADDLTIVRGGGASVPLFRAFITDRIVEPENGPASRELARVVARDLLAREPYRSRGIDLELFFSSGSSRMHDDLTVLSDRTWGWDDDYRHLARVGREAVLAHPTPYTRGVLRDVRRLLLWPLYAATPDSDDGETTEVRAGRASSPGASAEPPPASTDDEPIPSSREAPYISTPDGRIREVWTSSTEHSRVFRDTADARHSAVLDERIADLYASFPDRGQRPALVDWLNRASRWYPRPIVWLLLGAVAVAIRRPQGSRIPVTLAAAALLVLLATALAVYAVAEYSVPVVPTFILLAAVGLFGVRSRVEPCPASS